MKLNIYENKKIIKTYEADTYDLMYGTVTDLVKALDLDKLKSGKDEDILDLIMQFLMNGLDAVNDLLKDIFEGLTDEELKKTKIKEIAIVLMQIVNFTFNQIGTSSKN